MAKNFIELGNVNLDIILREGKDIAMHHRKLKPAGEYRELLSMQRV